MIAILLSQLLLLCLNSLFAGFRLAKPHECILNIFPLDSDSLGESMSGKSAMRHIAVMNTMHAAYGHPDVES